MKDWNLWREYYPYIEIDLTGADLSHAILTNVDLTGADLYDANLSNANF